MVSQRIIKPVGDKATEWCSPMIVVRKPGGGIRICVDLSKLNKFVKRSTHPGASPKEVISDIPPYQKYFSTMDAIKGYWQIALAEKSQELTTFITPWGRYKYLRAPMGLSSTGDKYNLLMDAAIDGLDNQKKVVDDILLYAKDVKEHVTQVKKLLQRFRDHGVSVSKSKFNFAKPEVKYVGYIVKADGVELDPTKFKAISKFPAPTNLTELRSFMGLVNQMSGHSKEVNQAAQPLQPLMKKKNTFQWMEEHQQAMEKVKELLVSPMIRTHFDPRLPTILECDAARRKGMGYALMQKHGDNYKLVEAESRWLSSAEQNYGMTSLELAGVYWATQKCKLYLLGLPSFEIITDHQPLVSIINSKTLDEIENPRQKNMKEKIQQQFNFVVKWKAGKRCLFLMLCQDHLFRIHPKIMEWMRWRCLMKHLLSTRSILNRQKIRKKRKNSET